MYIEPTPAQGAAFFGAGHEGPVVMLNLLRFRDIADYTAFADLAPEAPISGAEAYARYAAHTRPYLEEAGGRVLFQGRGTAALIGPPDERWDLVLLVEHKSAVAFMSFARNKGYLSGVGHRTAALEDSRLIPILGAAGARGQ